MITAIKTLGVFVLSAWIIMAASYAYYLTFVRNRDIDDRIEHWMRTHGFLALHLTVQNHLMRIVLVYVRIKIAMWNMLNRCMELIIGGDDDV